MLLPLSYAPVLRSVLEVGGGLLLVQRPVAPLVWASPACLFRLVLSLALLAFPCPAVAARVSSSLSTTHHVHHFHNKHGTVPIAINRMPFLTRGGHGKLQTTSSYSNGRCMGYLALYHTGESVYMCDVWLYDVGYGRQWKFMVLKGVDLQLARRWCRLRVVHPSIDPGQSTQTGHSIGCSAIFHSASLVAGPRWSH